MALGFLPFDETANPMTANFVKYIGKDNLSGFASWGFTSGLLFQQAAKAVVRRTATTASPAPTCWRSSRPSTTSTPAAWWRRSTSATGRVSPCFMLEQYKSGKFVRVYPTKKGTFDCKKSNRYTFQEDLNK